MGKLAPWIYLVRQTVPILQGFKVAMVLLAFLIVLIGYVWSFHFVQSTRQFILPFALAMFVFIFRKTVLSLTDRFSIETAMVISGLWVESLADMFRVMAIPYVKHSSTFVVLWIVNFFTITSNLVFLTNSWFSFRIWIKAVLNCLFRGGHICLNPPHREISLVEDPDERGHSNNMPGYHCRQVRFYMWKVVGQASASIIYISSSAALRQGMNKAFFPFTRLTDSSYNASLLFAAGNLIAIFISGLAGTTLVLHLRPSTFAFLKREYARHLGDAAYVAFVCLVVVSSGLVSLIFVLYHARLWYAWPTS
ncbi:hypothetical protein Pelo_10438 [Pelomyxa schiedti]|nr:hypothetical protein Pelo_10438 [Pelomyxa schiedti]